MDKKKKNPVWNLCEFLGFKKFANISTLWIFPLIQYLKGTKYNKLSLTADGVKTNWTYFLFGFFSGLESGSVTCFTAGPGGSRIPASGWLAPFSSSFITDLVCVIGGEKMNDFTGVNGFATAESVEYIDIYHSDYIIHPARIHCLIYNWCKYM